MAESSNTIFVILDTNALLRAPGTLTHQLPGYEFVVPSRVVEQLARSSATSGSAMASLVAQATAAGNVVVPVGSPFNLTAQPERPPRLDQTDREVLDVASKVKRDNPNSRVVIATDDRDIRSAADSVGAEKLSSVQLRELIDSAKETRPLQAALATELRSEKSRLAWSAVTGLLGILAGKAGLKPVTWLLSMLPYWGTALVLLLGAVLLYRLRAKRRLYYGTAELLFGLGAALNLGLPLVGDGTPSTSSVIGLVASVYVMVRGLDNVGLGVAGTTFEPVWRRFVERG